MARSAVRAAASLARTPGGPSTEAKLALVELLVGVEDPAECIQRALDWLGEHVGVAQAVVAEIDETGSRLVASGGYGLPAGRVEQFSVDLEERDHPLVAALGRIRPVVLDAAAAASLLRVLPFRGPIAVAPFEGLRGGERVLGGVLMGSPGSPENTSELHWLAEILGNRVIRTRWLRRVARERSLLYSILNAVPDPIMLTDSEGRLIIANTRAEALFASRAEQSEGRRRAVALNNMLFSAALGRKLDQGRRAGPPRAAAGRLRRGLRPPLRAAEHDVRGLPRGHGGRLRAPERHRPAPRHRGDRGELRAPAHGRVRGAGGARPPRPHPGIGGRSHRGHRPVGQHHADERRRRPVVHRVAVGEPGGAPARPRQRRQLHVVRLQPLLRRGGPARTGARSASSTSRPACPSPWRRARGRSSPTSTAS